MSLATTCFSFDYKSVLIDEIALNGLEGIGFDFLWKRVEKRLSCSLTTKMKTTFWSFIMSTKCITFYNLKNSIPILEVLDRFTIIDEATGQLKDPSQPLDGPYEYCPIENEYGSCPSYKTRVMIPHEFLELKSYEEVIDLYGDTLVMVASLQERWHALAPFKPMSILPHLTMVHFCILELVGKGRENGQMTVGNSNLNKVVKESKFLFYNRKLLQDLDLIRVQCLTQMIADKGMKSILLRLTRFHEPSIKSQPKLGKIYDLAQYLSNLPNFCEKNEVMIRKGYLTPQQSKRLQKTVNIFKFEDKEGIRKKHITLVSQSDESSHSEDESAEEPTHTTQYKVGIGLLRQAYERFLDAGLKGLTQIEVAQLLGVEFYTSRTICRIFKNKNIVQEFLEDKGKQRTARYIASVATKKVDFKYAEEKKELMDYLTKNRKRCISENKNDVPEKRAKLEPDDERESDNIEDDIDKKIIEVKVLDGLEDRGNKSLHNAKKKPTLRQLKFATGILKVLKDRQFVTGYQTLSNYVHKETGEAPMDTKSLKLVIQKLITDGHVKVFKMKLISQVRERYSLFMCQPHVKKTDPLVRSFYSEISAKAKSNYRNPIRRYYPIVNRPLTSFTYPRYLKLQKLHEHIMNVVYFTDTKSYFTPGFSSLHFLIPEMTVELALGNITYIGETNNIGHIQHQTLELKLRDAPDSLRNILIYSKHLQNSVRGSLKMLSVLGLIQCIKSPNACVLDNAGPTTFVFYVNRHAKIIDTCDVWPRPNSSAAMERSYHFKTFDDVITYWSDVQNISLNTTITLRKRERYRYVYPVYDETDVLQLDDGRRFGDGLGPCGFDSTIFMDIPRLWRTYCCRNLKPKIQKVFKSQIKYKKGCRSGPKDDKKKVIKVKKKHRSVCKIDKSKPKPKPVKVPGRRIRNETTVKWSKFDDKVLMMLKIAVAIMSPVPGSIKVRNLVAKALLSTCDPAKTAAMCHRRSIHLENNPELAHEKLCILNELRRRRDLIEKYEGLMKVLRIRHYANLPKFIKEARLPMLELLWIIYQVAKSKPYLHHMPCVASNLEEFTKNYIITASVSQNIHNLYKTPIDRPRFASLKEAIVLTVMMSLYEENTKDTAEKIYSLFKVYPEPELRLAIEELRKSGAIAARDKIFNHYGHKVHINDIVQSCYKISYSYKKRWTNRLSSQFNENIADMINQVLPQTGLKGTSEINCVFFEMYTCGVLDIVSVTVPVIIGSMGSLIQEEKMNIIDMESKYKLKSGTVGCKNISKLKTFSELYKSYNFEEIFAEYCGNVVTTYNEDHITNTEDGDIIKHLKENKNGFTFSELQDLTKMERKLLCEKLLLLEKDDIIKRVGFYENRIVLKTNAMPWLFQISKNKYVIPTPWFDLEGKCNQIVFFDWASVIMNKIFECPGSSIEFLSNVYEFITARGAQDICVFLQKCGCIQLKCLTKMKVDLFSDDDILQEFTEFQPYESPQNILAFPLKDSITKYSYLKDQILRNDGQASQPS